MSLTNSLANNHCFRDDGADGHQAHHDDREDEGDIKHGRLEHSVANGSNKGVAGGTIVNDDNFTVAKAEDNDLQI